MVHGRHQPWTTTRGCGNTESVYQRWNLENSTTSSRKRSRESPEEGCPYFGWANLQTVARSRSVRDQALNGACGSATNTDDVKGKTSRRNKVKGSASRRGKSKNTASGRGRTTFGLSECASKYALAIADPFNPRAIGACVPTHPSVPSQKLVARTRAIEIVVGTGGVGGAFISPCVANDDYIVAASTSSYSSSTWRVVDGWAALGSYSITEMSSLPYAHDDVNSVNAFTGVRSRLVSCGVRVEYVGTMLNMGGQICGFFDPDHNPVAEVAASSYPQWDVATITQRPYAELEAVRSNMNFEISTFAANPEDTTYQMGSYPYATAYSSSLATTACGVIVVTGEPGNRFRMELVEHIEYIGTPASSGLSPSHADSKGFEIVSQAAGQLALRTASTSARPAVEMPKLIKEAVKSLAPVAADYIMPGSGKFVRNGLKMLDFRG